MNGARMTCSRDIELCFHGAQMCSKFARLMCCLTRAAHQDFGSSDSAEP